MNAPMDPAVAARLRAAMDTISLDDKYTLTQGRAFMSGVQALVRLPMLQQQRDQRVGKHTAGFISGYRGSPLGGYDQMLQAASEHLQKHNIVFQPGVNEELGATAVWGTQMLGYAPKEEQQYDGVFGIWYGKGPGVDRSVDVFKHANMAGTTPWGGVIAIAGDDHISKSSTAAHQSDHIFKACGFPVFFPSNVQEILDLGIHAFAMSRFAGVWTGMKTIQEVVESSASVEIDPERVKVVIPDFEMPPGGVHIRWPDPPLEQEARLFNTKWYAALAYIRANKLNHNVIEGPNDRLGIISSGKAYNDLRQALQDLGLDEATCQRIGLRVHKVGVVWPLEAHITRDFATGLDEILVVEEKRQLIEYQIKEQLYNWRNDVRPNVLGQFDEMEGDMSGGEWSMPNPSEHILLRATADLNPAIIARAVAARLIKMGVPAEVQARMEAQLAILDAQEAALKTIHVEGGDRTPWFCSGCPHNTSTRLPEGSRGMAGIGCHYMVNWMDREHFGFTQMGGEGVPWVGQAPFTNEKHLFTNLGDGTYFHSGLLAIRQSIAAGVNITYKILYNDAVAMTGGQRVGERPEGHTVLQIANSVVSEGVSKLVLVSDQPEKYQGVTLPGGARVYHRDDLDEVQRELRETPGTTVMIYDQTCATEKRRRRKRGLLEDPAKRVVINEAVCEGCGDCGVQSNCLSVEPLETEFGRKRMINQSTCNKDYSCVKGFCPSFVTVEGGQLRKAPAASAQQPERDLSAFASLPEPALPVLRKAQGDQPADVWGTVVAGVGGTGVITIGQLLGVAAHLEGKGIVTQDAAGLAQKGGATWSHVLIGPDQDAIRTTRVSLAGADLILGCDPLVAAHQETTARMRHGRTHVALNSSASPTAAFVKNTRWQNPAQQCASAVADVVGPEHLGLFDAEAMARELLGDTLFVNPMILGYAWQKGWIPLSEAALLRAMELNNVQVDKNKQAFLWGRRAAHDYAAVQKLLAPSQIIAFRKPEALADVVKRRVAFLTDYQNAAYASEYSNFVDRVAAAEATLPALPNGKPRTSIALAVAHNLFKLMAYKDEYEVARLFSNGDFEKKIADMFEGDYTIHYHLAPPSSAKTNAKGELLKREYGPRMMQLFKFLARFKGLRGGALDVFGRHPERVTERALIRDYRALIEHGLQRLTPETHKLILQIAQVPDSIRGFGHVKERNLAAARTRWQDLRAQLDAPASGNGPAAVADEPTALPAVRVA